MEFFEKFRDRYNILILVLVILMFLLSLQLAILTIAKGDYYRDKADNLRLRKVETTAPRGEIRDRNGKLLAGNVPNFTVQLFKDEIYKYDKHNKKEKKNLEKNRAFLILSRLLEEDGIDYEDEFPLQLNTFEYEDDRLYNLENKDPIDKVVDIIVEKDLLKEVVSSYYVNNDYPEHFDYITANRIINAYKKKGIDIPVELSIENGRLKEEFIDEDVSKWKNKYDIGSELGPIDSIVEMVSKDKTIIKNAIDHTVVREMVYDILKKHNLTKGLVLEDYSITYKKDYYKQKRFLNKSFPEVDMNTSALEDFANIFEKTSLNSFLYEEFEQDSRLKKSIIPGEILLDILKNKGIETSIRVKRDKNKFYYINDENKDMSQDEIVSELERLAIESNLVKKLVDHEDIRPYAQSQLIKDGVNSKISISSKDLEYVSLEEFSEFLEEHFIRIEDLKEYKDILEIPEELILEKLIEYYNIDQDLSEYEIIPVLNIYDRIKRQGHLAYQPINIAYGLRNSTVAKIEENLMEVPGIDISIEPVRYYPEGKTAAHILGYLGKISQEDEIEKYIEEKGYSENDIIGKTGIEESFEEYLRGENGIKKVEVDPLGNTIKNIESESRKPVPGSNLYLSLDLDLQKVAEEALKETLEKLQVGGIFESKWGNYQFGTNRGRPYSNANSGAVVVLDVKTGQVLASASYPSYDPNLFSTGISTTDWTSLFPKNEDDILAPRPLYNIVTQTAVQPGSVYKMATALAAMDKGLSPNTKIRDMGYIDIGAEKFNCLVWTLGRQTHGYVDVRDALKDSCNYYFYTLALGENQKTGEKINVRLTIDDIVEMNKKLGLGESTGIEINIPGEARGTSPDPEKKREVTKAMLKNYLEGDIHKYYLDSNNPTDEEKAKIIEEIASWTELEEIPGKGDIVKWLYDLGIDAEKKLTGDREDLADKIKYTYINQASWNITDTLNVTIGQGQNAFTPIQMANYVSTISNGGFRHKLSLIDSIKTYNNKETLYEHKVEGEKIELRDPSNLEDLMEGMRRVARGGTASAAFANFPEDVGVKTGTAENKAINPTTGKKYDDFAWMVGFAPYDDPEIAIATVLFQGGSGAYGAPLVREIMAEYLGLNEDIE